MGPKKKQPRNAFYFFMLDWREEQEQKGFRFPHGLKDVADKAGPAWKNLDPAVQADYKARADEEKAKEKLTGVKYTSQGRKVEDVEREADEKTKMKITMEKDIFNTVAYIAKRPDVLKQHIFYAIHCNPLLYWKEKDRYIAAEVAIVEFSIEEGLRKTLHFFPEIAAPNKTIPLGYAFEASYREKQHGISPDHKETRLDTRSIYTKIKDFVTPNGGATPPLYTMGDDEGLNFSMTCVEHFLDEIAYKTGTESFKVYDIALLFYELEGACSEIGKLTNPSIREFPAKSIAKAELERDVFNYSQGLSCKFHENSDLEHNCSLAIATRWAFLVTGEYCCERLGISLKPGKHVPLDSKLSSVPAPVVKVESTRRKQPVAERLERSLAPQRSNNSAWSATSPSPIRVKEELGRASNSGPPPAIRIKTEPASGGAAACNTTTEDESLWTRPSTGPPPAIRIKDDPSWSADSPSSPTQNTTLWTDPSTGPPPAIRIKDDPSLGAGGSSSPNAVRDNHVWIGPTSGPPPAIRIKDDPSLGAGGFSSSNTSQDKPARSPVRGPPPAIRIKDEFTWTAAASPTHNAVEEDSAMDIDNQFASQEESAWGAASSSPDIDIKDELGWSTVPSSRHKPKDKQARSPAAAFAAPSPPRNKEAHAWNATASPPAQKQFAWGAAPSSDFEVKEEFAWSTVPPSSRNTKREAPRDDRHVGSPEVNARDIRVVREGRQPNIYSQHVEDSPSELVKLRIPKTIGRGQFLLAAVQGMSTEPPSFNNVDDFPALGRGRQNPQPNDTGAFPKPASGSWGRGWVKQDP